MTTTTTMDFQRFKNRKTREECLSYMADCEKHILGKAVHISQQDLRNIVTERTDVSDSFCTAVTSTPNRERISIKKGNLKAVHRDCLDNEKNIYTSSDSVSASKVLSMVKDKRREEIQRFYNKQKANMQAQEEISMKQVASLQEQLKAQSEARALQNEERRRRLDEEEEANIAELQQRQKMEQQEHAQRASRVDEEIKAKEEAEAERKRILQMKGKYCDEILQYHVQVRELYQNIVQANASLSDKDKQTFSVLLAQVPPLHKTLESFIPRMRDLSINQNDVNVAKNICVEIKSILKTFQDHIAKTKRDEESREILLRQEQMKAEAQVIQNQDSTTVGYGIKEDTNSCGAELSGCSDKESLKRYQELQDFKKQNEKLFESLLRDDNLKKYRFDCQKAVNIPVNAISPVSASHMRDKLQKLSLLLSGQPVVIGDGVRVSASQHPAGIPFCKDLLAKKFVRQGGSTVSSKPEAAFAIASVMVALWQEFPDWGQLLLAHFHKECPYLVPVFWPQFEGQSKEDYYMSLGYNYIDGEVEKQDKFLKRMSGIMRLYASVLVSSPPRDRQNRPHPHNISQGWRWLSSLLNLEPQPDICATLLYDFLEVAGSSMSQHYDKQYAKLLLFICKDYFPRLSKLGGSSGGPVGRLEIALQAILKSGSKPPKGMLPLNFW